MLIKAFRNNKYKYLFVFLGIILLWTPFFYIIKIVFHNEAVSVVEIIKDIPTLGVLVAITTIGVHFIHGDYIDKITRKHKLWFSVIGIFYLLCISLLYKFVFLDEYWFGEVIGLCGGFVGAFLLLYLFYYLQKKRHKAKGQL